jgi:hypothetical protein
MCMNCGCGEINERHGNQGNIVLEDVRRAANASGLDMNATVKNLQQSLGRVGDTGMATSGASAQASMGSSEMGRRSGGSDVPRV